MSPEDRQAFVHMLRAMGEQINAALNLLSKDAEPAAPQQVEKPRLLYFGADEPPSTDAE